MSAVNSTLIKIVIVDDHEVVRLGLRTVFSRVPDFDVVGEADSVVTAVKETLRLKPDVVVLDVRLPDGSGVEACWEIRATLPGMKVLFLTSYGDDEAMLAAVLAGAQGYLLKEIRSDFLIQAVRTVAAGQSVLDAAATQAVLAHMRSLSENESESDTDDQPLSPQEQRVIALVAEGKTNKEISVELSLSSKTIKNYLSNIFQKLRVKRRSHAAAIYSRRSPK